MLWSGLGKDDATSSLVTDVMKVVRVKWLAPCITQVWLQTATDQADVSDTSGLGHGMRDICAFAEIKKKTKRNIFRLRSEKQDNFICQSSPLSSAFLSTSSVFSLSILLIHLPIPLIFISLLYFVQHNCVCTGKGIFSFQISLSSPSPLLSPIISPYLIFPLVLWSPSPYPSFSLFPYLSSLVTFSPRPPAPPPPSFPHPLMIRFDLFYFVIWVVCMFLLLLFSITSPFVCLISPPSFPRSLSRDNRRAPLLCHFSGRQPLIHVPIMPSAQGAIGARHKRHKQSSIPLSSLCSRPPPRLYSLSSPPIRLSFCRAFTVGTCSASFPSPSSAHLPFIARFLVSSPYQFAFRLPSVSSVCSVFFCTPHTAVVTRCVYLLKHRENSSKFEGLFTEVNLFGFLSSAPKRTSMRIISLFREFESGFVSGVDHRT